MFKKMMGGVIYLIHFFFFFYLPVLNKLFGDLLFSCPPLFDMFVVVILAPSPISCYILD